MKQITSFTSGNESTTTPITNTNILWGAVAAAAVGMTLAEWQKRRDEEEKQRQSERPNTAGRKKYEEKMRMKRIIGESQQLLDKQRAERAKQNTVASARWNGIAKIEQAKEKAKQIAVSAARWTGITQIEQAKEKVNVGGNKPLANLAKQDDPPPDNVIYDLPTFNPNKQTALEWLVDLYRNNDLRGNTVLERTKYILNATESGNYVHFNEKIATGDSGFNTNLQDHKQWPDSGNQVGHYLTAVDISIRVNSFHPIIRPITRFFGISSIVGHEMLGDNITIHQAPFIGHAVQTWLGIKAQVLSLGKVDDWMCSQSDEDLDKILAYGPFENSDYFHYGNGKEDLRLSCEGWITGEKIIEGHFDNLEEIASYIEETLK
jgi:hypothetical protein